MRLCFAVHSNHGDAILDPEYCEKLKKPGLAAPVYGNCDGIIMVSHYQAFRWIAGMWMIVTTPRWREENVRLAELMGWEGCRAKMAHAL
jgi:hypothetical protein